MRKIFFPKANRRAHAYFSMYNRYNLLFKLNQEITTHITRANPSQRRKHSQNDDSN